MIIPPPYWTPQDLDYWKSITPPVLHRQVLQPPAIQPTASLALPDAKKLPIVYCYVNYPTPVVLPVVQKAIAKKAQLRPRQRLQRAMLAVDMFGDQQYVQLNHGGFVQ